MPTIQRMFLLPLLLIPLFACSETAVRPATGVPVEGVVIEEGTNKPLAGVIVVGHWLGTATGWGHGSTVCRHVETATTDERGRYRMTRWEGREPTATYSYKAGYERSEAYYKTRSWERGVDILTAAPEEKEARLAYLERLGNAVGCPQAGESEMNMLLIRKALYLEAVVLIGANDKPHAIESFLFPLEMLQFGHDAAVFRQIERVRARK